MKQLTAKQAQKWLLKLKTANSSSYKDIARLMKKYERAPDDYECFVKINMLLLEFPDLTREINTYLQQGNKLIIKRTEVDKINELVKYVKKVKPQAFEEIVNMIRDLSSRRDSSMMTQEQQNQILKNFVLEKVKGNRELEAYADKALNYTAEEDIQKMELKHLKANKLPPPVQRQEESVEPSQLQPSAIITRIEEPLIEDFKAKIRVYPPFLNTSEEKIFLRNLQASLAPEIYENLVKMMEIYRLGIISKSQVLQFAKPLVLQQYQGIKDILQTRENDRRRNCDFKPLNDMDFNNAQRATPSYVRMPQSYPSICSSSNQLCQQTLNRKWVSVPRGSQDQFNLRVRNTFQQNLIRSQDDRYQLDIFLNRMRKCQMALKQIIEQLSKNSNADVEKLVKKVISFGVIQIIYKSANKQQKQQMQYYLKTSTLQIANLLSQRIASQIVEVSQIRQIHGIRNWSQVAVKNATKALDFKGHQFKRTQKVKMKGNVFIEQLKSKINFLDKRGMSRDYQTPFEEKKQFFSVFNSFQTTSRKQRCQNRKLPEPQVYDLSSTKIPSLLPAMILAFENQNAFNSSLSYIGYYIQNGGLNQNDKNKCRYILRVILCRFFRKKQIQFIKPSQKFDQQKLVNILSQFEQSCLQSIDFDEYVTVQKQKQTDASIDVPEQQKIPTLKTCSNKISQYNYLPYKNQKNSVFYASQNFYVFLRFFYALYERIIRLQELSESCPKKSKMFQLLYFSNIKNKDSAKFEDYLNTLFKDSAYIFATFYKLIQSLVKSLVAVGNCITTSYSFKILQKIQHENEDIYLLLMNKFYLLNNISNPKVLRFTLTLDNDKLLYINSLQSFYRPDENKEALQKRRYDISSKIQMYTKMRDYTEYQHCSGVKEPEKQQTESNKTGNKKPIHSMAHKLVKNNMQYHFQGNTIRLMDIGEKQDSFINLEEYGMVQSKREAIKNKRIRKQLEKLKQTSWELNGIEMK